MSVPSIARLEREVVLDQDCARSASRRLVELPYLPLESLLANGSKRVLDLGRVPLFLTNWSAGAAQDNGREEEKAAPRPNILGPTSASTAGVAA